MDAAPQPQSPSIPEHNTTAYAPTEHSATYAPPEPTQPETERRRVSRWVVFGRLCALVYVLIIGVATLLPDPTIIFTLKIRVAHIVRQIAIYIVHMRGITLGDITSNIAAFIPLTLLLALAWRRRPLWVSGVVGMCISITAETLQLLLPQIHRRPYIWNVVENSIGAWIGVAIAAVIFQLTGRPHQEAR